MQIVRMQYNDDKTITNSQDVTGMVHQIPYPCNTWHCESIQAFLNAGGKIEPYTPSQEYWLNGKKSLLVWPKKLPEGARFEKPFEVAAQERRTVRDELLRQSDWAVLPDAPLSDGKKQEWMEYRQALRDIPQQSGFPEQVVMPELPVR